MRKCQPGFEAERRVGVWRAVMLCQLKCWRVVCAAVAVCIYVQQCGNYSCGYCCCLFLHTAAKQLLGTNRCWFVWSPQLICCLPFYILCYAVIFPLCPFLRFYSCRTISFDGIQIKHHYSARIVFVISSIRSTFANFICLFVAVTINVSFDILLCGNSNNKACEIVGAAELMQQIACGKWCLWVFIYFRLVAHTWQP